MFITTIKRVLRNAVIGFWRNGLVSIATILVMVITLFVVGSLVMFQVILASTLENVQSKVDVSVYFKTDAGEKDILSLKASLAQLPEVMTVDYVSRDRALAVFKERHKGNTLIASALDELGGNPLGASLNIRAQDPSQYEPIARYLESGGFSYIDKVNYAKNKLVFERLSAIISASRRTGAGITLVLALITGLVTFNTVRLAIYTARDEIGVMKLVGASNRFIRMPFVVQGAMHGLLSAVIVMLMFWPFTLWLGPKVYSFFGGADLYAYFVQNVLQFFGILVVVGVSLGVVSSFMATRRYLKA